MLKRIFSLSILFILISCSEHEGGYCALVNPLIGSGGHGHVFVGANVPHGMISVGPNNVSEGWDWCSGYHDSEQTIAGFAQTHLSGTGVTDLGEVVLMPYLGTPVFDKGTGCGDGFAVTFEKEDEIVRPGYYEVNIMDGRLQVRLTASGRVAYHRYVKDESASGEDLGLILDLKSSARSLLFRQGLQDSKLVKADDYTITGFRMSDEWARDHKVYFAARFNHPILSVEGENPVYALSFGDKDYVDARVSVSYSSVEGALANLEAESDLHFEDVLAFAGRSWSEELSRIEFKGIDSRVDTLFYTSLYHTSFAPQLYSDAGQPDDYTIFSTWDTYRAAHPLYNIIDPRAGDYVNSLLKISETSGRLPVWHLAGYETDCMVGVHSVPIIVDAALKGVEGVDPRRALAEVKKFAQQPVPDGGLEYIDSLGYLPADKVNWSVSRALEYCIDDDAVARLASALGDEQTAEYYAARAKNYRHYFDPVTGYMRGKLSDGSFREPYDPSFSLHEEADYVEGNGWQYTWLVPHDPYGLIELFGGNEPFLRQLDALFLADEALNEGASADITGMIGQYAHGNEPSHHTLYLYAYAGEQYKTAEKVRQVCREFYTTQPDGLIGNEDCGQMSAWYIFTALGFYPVHPTAGEYVFGSPLCTEAVIHTVDGTDFKVVARNNSDENIYIQSVTLNGKPYDKFSISHEDIMKGGELVFEMGPEKK
ncbi:MAG: GH92 family glycosyl hydrolase [Bacteroidales bacterium]|nr:GH92 family glycosyl hydrolase [Bacteroidales bacterium]